MVDLSKFEMSKDGTRSLDSKEVSKHSQHYKNEEDMCRELRENNEKIVHCLFELRSQREDLIFLIEKQKEERKKLETEMERLTYKLCLINKSMAQRLKAKHNYDTTIQEIEEKYKRLRENSQDLRMAVGKECDELDSMINKKTSTDDVLTSKEVGTENISSEELIRSIVSLRSDSGSNLSKNVDDECVCLPNTDGKCIREKMVSKMIQAFSTDVDVPTKLEKERPVTSSKNKDHVTVKYNNAQKGAQALLDGEPNILEDESFIQQTSALGQMVNQYKDNRRNM